AARSRAPSLGQPSVESGQSHDENQVSSTSSSWRTAPPHAAHADTSSRLTMGVPPHASQYHTGMRWPHHNWREMFQSRMFSIQFTYTASHRSGSTRSRPARNASSAGLASGAMRTNHWSDKRGSTTVSQR